MIVIQEARVYVMVIIVMVLIDISSHQQQMIHLANVLVIMRSIHNRSIVQLQCHHHQHQFH